MISEPLAPAQRNQWILEVNDQEINLDQDSDLICQLLEDQSRLQPIITDLKEALTCSSPELMIEKWIDLEPAFMSIITFKAEASADGVDIQELSETNASISEVITKVAAGVMLRGGFSDHFRYMEDGTLVIDPTSPPTLDQAYELLKRTLEMKETASRLDNYTAWMLGMIADQFEAYFGDSFDSSTIMEQTSKAYTTYISALGTYRAWWNERRQISFTHHREVHYAKHLDHDTGGRVLDISEKLNLTVLQQRKIISFAKRFGVEALEGEIEDGEIEDTSSLMERIDIRAVNKRYVFFLRGSNRWYVYKGPFENIPNGASPIINSDTREVIGQDGRPMKPEEWVPVGTPTAAPITTRGQTNQPDELGQENEH